MKAFNHKSKFYRCLCNETMEEQVFATVEEAEQWAQKVARTFGESKTFTLILVRETETKLSLDTFGRKGFLP